jgi:hypothetical protein
MSLSLIPPHDSNSIPGTLKRSPSSIRCVGVLHKVSPLHLRSHFSLYDALLYASFKSRYFRLLVSIQSRILNTVARATLSNMPHPCIQPLHFLEYINGIRHWLHKNLSNLLSNGMTKRRTSSVFDRASNAQELGFNINFISLVPTSDLMKP